MTSVLLVLLVPSDASRHDLPPKLDRRQLPSSFVAHLDDDYHCESELRWSVPNDHNGSKVRVLRA